ncbi:AraC family transcriptional regulator [archaeon]|nr:AraC family transcriptional regulator [archaeon]
MKQVTKIDYLERIQRVLRHIEDHLDEPLRLRDLSSVACFSEFHFHRIFLATMGMTIQDYVSFRRLVRAAKLLIDSSLRITDISLEAGYETMSAFTQAFKRYFSISPSRFRKQRSKRLEEIFLPEIINPVETLKRQIGSRACRSERTVPDIRKLPDLRVMSIAARGLKNGNFAMAAKDAFLMLRDHIEIYNLHDRVVHRLGMLPYIPFTYDDPEAVFYCGLSVKEDVPLSGIAEMIDIEGGRYAVFFKEAPMNTCSMHGQTPMSRACSLNAPGSGTCRLSRSISTRRGIRLPNTWRPRSIYPWNRTGLRKALSNPPLPEK